jgi:cyclase
MKYFLTSAILPLLFLLAGSAFAQQQSGFTTTQLAPGLYEITSKNPGSVNMLASVGDDGILLVDAGAEVSSPEFKEIIESFGKGEVKIIINTHAHPEHLLGNSAFGNNVIKIGHASLRGRLTSGAYMLQEFPESMLPTIGFADSMNLYFNGENIRLIADPGAHDDGDIIVHFEKSKVVCMGGLGANDNFPYVDPRGGNALQYSIAIRKAIDLLPADVILVPGHERNCTMAEEKDFLGMIENSIADVKAGLAAGKDAGTMQKEKILNKWPAYNNAATEGPWIQAIADALQNKKLKAPAGVELYKTIKTKDTEAAIAQWYELKKNNPNDYSFSEGQLVAVGYYLINKNRNEDAAKIFQLYVKEFPKAWNSYDCLAEAYMKMGNKKLAIKNYKKSLKLNPDNTNATNMLKTLES